MGAESSLPYRVNLVCGGRYALAKTLSGNCEVTVVQAHDVLVGSNRNSKDNKWLIKASGANQDSQGRPILCIIRNDHNVQRSLRAGSPVTVDGKQWTSEHRWLIEYVDSLRRSDAVGSPFLLLSLSNFPEQKYLTIDEDTGKAVMQTQRPEMLWEFFDANCQRKSLSVSYVGMQEAVRVMDSFNASGSSRSSGLTPLGRLEDWIDLPARSAVVRKKRETLEPREPEDPLQFTYFEGSVEDSLACQPRTPDGKRVFGLLQHFIDNGEPVGDEIELSTSSVNILGALIVGYGPDSPLRFDLAEDKDCTIKPLVRVPNSPWAATCGALFQMTIPIINSRRTVDDQTRIAFSRQNGVTTLAVQHSVKTAIGFPIGDYFCENFHQFTQETDGGPIKLRTIGIAQAGRMQPMAYSGMKQKRDFFVKRVRELISSASPSLTSRTVAPRRAEAEAEPAKPVTVETSAEGLSQEPSPEPSPSRPGAQEVESTAPTTRKKPVASCGAGLRKLGLIPCGAAS